MHLGEIPDLLRINYAAAQQTLYEDLMFGTTSLPRRTGLSLKDNLDYVLPHGYFYEFNKTTLSCTKLLREVCTVPTLAANFFVGGLTTAEFPTFSVDAMRIYEDCVQCFLRRLLVLIHVGSGQPLRAPEILSTRWKNTENHRRNVFIVDGRVMIHTTYHKGLNMTSQTKDNIRFLPTAIGELLLNFLCYVQPLRLAYPLCERVFPVGNGNLAGLARPCAVGRRRLPSETFPSETETSSTAPRRLRRLIVTMFTIAMARATDRRHPRDRTTSVGGDSMGSWFSSNGFRWGEELARARGADRRPAWMRTI